MAKADKYAHQEFPAFRFHPKHAPEGRLVNSQEDADKLGKGWTDSPANFAEPDAEPEGAGGDTKPAKAKGAKAKGAD